MKKIPSAMPHAFTAAIVQLNESLEVIRLIILTHRDYPMARLFSGPFPAK
jgi:hypothetical protein